MICTDTSSTAQGGGGSFKNRKPIGEIGCCESRMAERSHFWTDRLLTSLLFLSLSFSDYLPTYLPIYVSIYLSVCPSVRPSVHPSIHPAIHPSIRRSRNTLLMSRKRRAPRFTSMLSFPVDWTVPWSSVLSSLTATGGNCPKPPASTTFTPPNGNRAPQRQGEDRSQQLG